MEKVRTCCRKFPDLEWSGVLYYKAKNMDKGLYDLELELVDFVPLSVDTKAHTGFSYGAEHVEYAIEQGLTDHQFGDIHSHNTMQVFFSGTDNNDFSRNAAFYTYYLSVVVNNNEEICAKVGQVVEKKSIITGSKLGGTSTKEIVTKSVVILDCQLMSSDDEVFHKWLNKVERKPVVTPTHTSNVSKYDDWNSADWGYNEREPKKFWGYGTQATLFDSLSKTKFNLNDFICEVVLDNNNPNIKLTDALRDYDYVGIDLEMMMDEYSDSAGKKLEIHEEIKVIREIIERIERCNVNTRAVKSLLKDIKTELECYGKE